MIFMSGNSVMHAVIRIMIVLVISICHLCHKWNDSTDNVLCKVSWVGTKKQYMENGCHIQEEKR